MTTLTITDLSATGALQLTTASLGTITSISRSDANGVADVRTLPGVLPWTAERVEDLRNLVQNTTTGTNYNSARSTNTGGVGSSYTRFTADGTGATYIYYNGFVGGTGAGTGMMPVVPGDQVAANVDLRNSNAFTIQARLNWSYYDAAGASVAGAVSGNMQTLTAGGYAYPYLSHTVPAGAAYARVLIFWYTAAGASPAAGTTLDFKYLAAFKGAKAWAEEQTFFHGGSTDTTGVYAYGWAGTTYASESIRYRAAGDLIISDFEAASGAVTYTATDSTGELTTTSTSWALSSPWLFVPVMPSYSVQLKTLLEYSASGDSLGTIHDLLGRDDPVAVLRGMSTRRGTLRLYCGTFAEAAAVVQAVRRGEVLMLRQPDHQGMDMYFTATNYGLPTLEADGAGSVFGVDLGYVELARPDGDLTGSLGWTFAALASSQPKFANLPQVYATFQDVLLDRKK